MILQVLIAMVAGWINRHQQRVITYQQEEIRILKAKLGKRRIRFTDTERRRLDMHAHPLGRICLKAIATLATPDTLMRWYKRLVADKFDGSQKRTQLGRPRVPEEVERTSSAWPRESLLGLPPHPRRSGQSRPSHRQDYRAQYFALSPHRSRTEAASVRHELVTVSQDAMGGLRRYGLLHSRTWPPGKGWWTYYVLVVIETKHPTG